MGHNQDSFYRILSPPVFQEDEEKTRKAYRLNWVSVFGILMTLIYVVIYFFVLPQLTNRLILAIPVIILFSFVLIIIRSGYVRVASNILLFGLWAVITGVVVTSGGTRAPFFGFYMIVVLSSIIFSGWRVATFYTVLSVVAGAVMVYLANNGLIREPFATPASALLAYAALLTFVILDARVIVRDFQHSIRHTKEELAKRERAEMALRESEERFRLISSVTSDYTFASIFDEHGNLKHQLLSGAFQEITGYSPEEYMSAGGWRGCLFPDDLEQDTRDFERLSNNEKVTTEIRTITKQGTVRWVRVYANPVWDDNENRLIGINGGVQDITEQKENERTILNLNNELQSRYSQLASLNEIAREISIVNDLDTTLKLVQSTLAQTIDFDVFYVALHDSDDDMVTFPLMYDSNRYWQQEPQKFSQEGWINRVATTGEPMLLNRSDELLNSVQRQAGGLGDDQRKSASIMVAPLPHGINVIGVISVQSYTLDSYDKAHLQFLESAANQIAIAIENARLYDSLNNELAERKRLEAELQKHNDQLEQLVDERTNAFRRANEQLELVLNNTSNALAFANSSGDIVIKNPAFDLTFLDDEKQSIEKILFSIANEDQIEVLSDALLKAIYDNEHRQMEVKIISENGEEKDLDITLIPVEHHDDKPRQGVLVSGHDITKLKEVERIKARFVADAVHDLATPITGMSTRLYLLKKSPEKLQEHVNALENQVQHFRDLIEDLRTLSRMDRQQLELQKNLCNLNELVQRVFDTYEPVAIDKAQTLNFVAGKTLPEVNIDSRQIERVMVNLVSNAINYTPSKKNIHIETTSQDDMVVVRVTDEGMGIAEEDIPHVFDRFFRTSKARENLGTGTGLGLAITREIIELHEGSVSVTSKIGQGSTFTIQLPLSG